VEELAEFLAFEFKEEPIPGFHEDWRSEDPLDAVLSICSSLLSVVNEGRFISDSVLSLFGEGVPDV
jgi:hypothetical protein